MCVKYKAVCFIKQAGLAQKYGKKLDIRQINPKAVVHGYNNGSAKKGVAPVEELLRPTVDFVFKRIFGTQENKDLLIDFVNAVFEDSAQPLITDAQLLNPFLEKDALTE